MKHSHTSRVSASRRNGRLQWKPTLESINEEYDSNEPDYVIIEEKEHIPIAGASRSSGGWGNVWNYVPSLSDVKKFNIQDLSKRVLNSTIPRPVTEVYRKIVPLTREDIVEKMSSLIDKVETHSQGYAPYLPPFYTETDLKTAFIQRQRDGQYIDRLQKELDKHPTLVNQVGARFSSKRISDYRYAFAYQPQTPDQEQNDYNYHLGLSKPEAIVEKKYPFRLQEDYFTSQRMTEVERLMDNLVDVAHQKEQLNQIQPESPMDQERINERQLFLDQTIWKIQVSLNNQEETIQYLLSLRDEEYKTWFLFGWNYGWS
jgi:hypothetical protein